mmetsp:Transcript_75434/g.191433  ORF Transcript_75434/g.191433 Transcript_75434/m.191433 type:complete len:413 (+) Transcript_75434:92-1330(+)|eukprot:CAMPEP_0183433344 /NCGR_PEP_ID=MMETSP0370-20130417/61329_1 /TAXON_ID=268820 /ORGANISM="Peridinium aciculiferum, Strain PAER-2" /LENGTH=412 /DNA_ID=CAMNT_0025619661 /DNA_START=91 /DNA_END=1329 /DNA_ORIENTATION=+
MAPGSRLLAVAAAVGMGCRAWENLGGLGWQRNSQPPPWKAHTGSLAVTLPSNGRVLLIAGQAGEHGGALFDCFNCTKEVWSFDSADEKWEDLSAVVPWAPRWGHSAVVTSDDTVWMLFGCCEPGMPTVMLRDVWTYNPTKGTPWTLMKTEPPFEGIQATSVAVRGKDELWVCGGWSQSRGTLSQVAVLSLTTLAWEVKSEHGEAPWRHRADHATALSSDGGWLFLFAGQHRDEKTGRWSRLQDTWRVALPAARASDWQQLGDLNAARSSVPVLVLPSGWLLALGGHHVPDDEELKVPQEDIEGILDHHRKGAFSVYNDVLALDLRPNSGASSFSESVAKHSTWSVVEPNAPWPARDDCAAAVGADGSLLLFGGGTIYGGGGYLHDFWRLPSAAAAYALRAPESSGAERGSDL